MESKRVVIDGNICSGKSSQCSLLVKEGYSVLSEKIYDWPLKLFYSNPSRWALLLQFSILKSFDTISHIYERSPESSKCVFWKILLDEQMVNADENDVYTYFWRKNGWVPDVHIYIDTPPDVCFARISNRFQDGDSEIDLQYLRKIDRYYKAYIATKTNVHIIDGTDTMENINKKIKDIISNDMSWYDKIWKCM